MLGSLHVADGLGGYAHETSQRLLAEPAELPKTPNAIADDGRKSTHTPKLHFVDRAYYEAGLHEISLLV